MTPESLIQFKNLKNRTGEDLVGMILYELSGKSDEGNSKLETISAQLARGEEEEGLREMEERMDRRAAQEVLAGIKEAIERKNIDLSEVLAGLVMIAKEVRQGSDEAKALLQSIESKEHTDITGALSLIYEKMCEEKMENPADYTSIIESQKQGFDDVVRVLTELALASKEKRESESVKVEGEVNIVKPSWWKEYVLDWKPLEKLLAPIKNALEKLLEKETQELPIKDGRVLVSLDQKIGRGIGNPFSFDEQGNLKVAGGTSGGGDASEATLQSILAAVDTLETKLQSIADNTDTLEANTDGIEALLTQISGFVDTLETNTDGLETLTTAIRDYLDTVETKLQSLIDKSNGSAILKKTVALTGSGTVHDPAAGKKIRLYSIKFSLSADMTDVAFNFGANPDFEKYLTPKAGGLYGGNMHPDYVEGAVDENLDCVITGTGTVQINIEYLEM